ncbi:uncharacterized protein LOC131666173 [Phymastichus coffea]|uniref:uncharacterized protein LOC131666173 n=1 Tax=Phymastichus coffea TaxID=108790 RepID=UPI00273BFEC0|nr:uncharacterized protein LOC131666173 [Phymastichus coffea]
MKMSSSNDGKQLDHIKNILTFDEITEIAKNITNDKSVQVLNCNLNDLTNEKLGFTGTHHILTIIVQKPNAKKRETISAFVKIASLDLEGFDESIDINSFITGRESFLLNTLVSQFEKDCKSEKWCPIHYYTSKNAVIMENLKWHGYRIIEEFIDDQKVLKSVLASLARFHSCSILTETRMSQEMKRPISLNEHYKDKFQELVFIKTGEASSWFESVTKLTCALAEHFGFDSVKVRELFDRACDIIKPSEIHRNVVCHGDIHSKNLMFADNSPLLKCILIDFQTYRYAPMVTDILEFLHNNTTSKFREEHEASLVEFYHSILVDTIKSNDSTNNVKIPSLEDIFTGMKDLRLFGLVIACIYYPILFLDPELLKKHARDAEFNKNLVSGDRIELTFSQMEVNPFYKSKIEEAIRELIEKGA